MPPGGLRAAGAAGESCGNPCEAWRVLALWNGECSRVAGESSDYSCQIIMYLM